MLALEESALNVRDSDFLRSETTNERRTRKPRSDAQSLITRKLNAAGTLCRRALEIYDATGKHAQIAPEAVEKLEALLTTLKRIVRAARQRPMVEAEVHGAARVLRLGERTGRLGRTLPQRRRGRT